KQLGVDSVSDVVRVGRLRWFGHVMRKSDDEWVKKCQYLLNSSLNLQLISFFFKFHILQRSVAWAFLCLGRSSLNTILHNNNLCCLTHSSPFITVTSCIIDRSSFLTRM